MTGKTAAAQHREVLAKALRSAIQTEVNDDRTLQGTTEKERFIQRCNAMWAAADYLEDREEDDLGWRETEGE